MAFKNLKEPNYFKLISHENSGVKAPFFDFIEVGDSLSVLQVWEHPEAVCSINFCPETFYFEIERDSSTVGLRRSVPAFDFKNLLSIVSFFMLRGWVSKLNTSLRDTAEIRGTHPNYWEFEEKFKKATWLMRKGVIKHNLFSFWEKYVRNEDRLSKEIARKSFSVLGRNTTNLRQFIKEYPEKAEWLTRDANRWIFYAVEVYGIGILEENTRFKRIFDSSKVFRRSLSNIPRSLSPGIIRSVADFEEAIGLRETIPNSRKIWMLYEMLGSWADRGYGGYLELAEEIYDAYLRTEDPLKYFYLTNRNILNNTNVPRKVSGISNVWRTLLDFDRDDLSRFSDFSTIYRSSENYHANPGDRGYYGSRPRLKGELETEKPPVPLPEVEGLRFLETVEDLRIEGEEMEHCVGGYARRAVEGICFIFSYTHENGERATAEISPTGRIIQVQGFDNRKNTAVPVARRLLSEWLKENKEHWPENRIKVEAEDEERGIFDLDLTLPVAGIGA